MFGLSVYMMPCSPGFNFCFFDKWRIDFSEETEMKPFMAGA